MQSSTPVNGASIPARLADYAVQLLWAIPPLRAFWLFVALSVAYKLLRLQLLAPDSVQSSIVSLSILAFIALSGIGIRRSDLPRLTYCMLATSSVMISVVGLLHVPQYVPGTDPALDMAYWWARALGVLGAAAGIAAIARPSFSVIALALFYHLDRMTELLYEGLSRSVLDWLTVSEIMLFLGLIVVLHRWVAAYVPQLLKGMGESFVTHVTLYCVALHFANYFWSAVAKVLLPGGPLTWLLESPTYNDFTFNIYAGMFPIALLEGTPAKYLYATLQPLNTALNGLILSAQILAIVSVLRPRAMQAFAVIYDIFHVGVFFLGGILFYKWIALNAAIYVGLRKFEQSTFSRPLMACIGATVLGSPLMFSIAQLGWYSTAQGNYLKIEAVDEAGRVYEVPTNYWMARAFEVRSGRFRNAFDGFHAETALAGTTSYEFMQESLSCSAIPAGRADADRSHNRESLVRLIRQHHRAVLELVDENGHLRFDAYPHHAWSEFLGPRFAEFRALDKRTIDHYVVSLEAVCFRGLRSDGSPDVRVTDVQRLVVRP